MSNRIAGSIAGIILSIAVPTVASATCPTFHTLTNGTTADATQVMDNFNYVLCSPNFTGPVGIGTTSPSYPLHVQVNQDGATAAVVQNTNNTSNALAYVAARAQNNNLMLYSLSDSYSRPY